MNTRRQPANTSGKPRGASSTPKLSREPPYKTSALYTSDSDPDTTELSDLYDTLSEESQVLVKILKAVIAKEFKSELKMLKDQITAKDSQIEKLNLEVKHLNNKVDDLESHLDSVEQYERRDTIIINGPGVPHENHEENPVSLVVDTLKDKLKYNMKVEDISVAHRLGPVHQHRTRPLIVKLVNRSQKYDIVGACLKMKPDLYINESLTPRRWNLFKKILDIRKQHRQKFQQCYTKDGKIVVKLRNSTVKHVIVNDRSFNEFLDKYPEMKDTNLEIASAN